ncbi:DUF2637 domain-containing protein [Streptomyces sp. NBC_00377]|uniref:DUF2637 domain-containing protein n=1 Tax=unclassified Streptomyces TaxID=2593676 RepID=UPI002E218E2D|nr:MULTISPECIES: DUF2637 domain-containing protein [unclassified Streptomyces]
MSRSIRPDAVLIQAIIAGALSFAHLHDLAEAAGQTGWKAWAYPISVDLLLVAAWRRLRTARRDRSAWTWFVIALTASLGANIATAGLLDLGNVPSWLRILVAGWPALAFLGGTLLVHSPAEPTAHPQPVDEPAVVEVETHRTDIPVPPTDVPELDPAPVRPAPAAPTIPAALLDHARKLADTHRTTTGAPMPAEVLAARLSLPAPMTDAIAAQLQLT